MSSTTSDLLQSLPTYDSSDEEDRQDGSGGGRLATKQTARERRIEAARLAASSYNAKMEEPQWFLDTDSTQSSEGPRSTIRPELFALEHYYLLGEFALVKRRGLDFLNNQRRANERNGQDKAKPSSGSNDGASAASGEESQVLDAVMRSALKLDEVDREVVEWARLYKTRPTAATLAYTAARVLDRAGTRFNVGQNEALEASLSALTRSSTLKPYVDLLADLLASRSPFLSQGIKQRKPATTKELQQRVQDEINKLELSPEARDTFIKVVGAAGQAHEEQEELPRDVRSL
ncbi:hypothetical protein ACM66B_006611 [Microbotryomycetes sp. NB124-2]